VILIVTFTLLIAAFSGHNLSSGHIAFRVLSQLWSRPFPETAGLASLILFAMIRLGAPPAVFEAMDCATAEASNEFVNEDSRAIAIYRLVTLSKLASWYELEPFSVHDTH